MTFRSTAMGADNLLLFILVWTVCQADDNVCSVSCENVTGTVGEEVTFTCSVSQKCSECCFRKYKFQYLEKYKNSTICRQEFPEGSCEQRNSFTCRYTPTTSMTGQFRFFVLTVCGMKRTEFTVNITEPSKPEIITEAPDVCSVRCADVTGTVGKEVTFTCDVSQKRSECCITMYKFQYPEKYKNSAICKQDLQGSCEQRNSVTCRYTPTTEMTEEFRFFVQTNFGAIRTEFIVDITESIKPETAIEAPGFCHVTCADMTVTVGKEVTLTCSVPQQCIECCITLYKIYYTKTYTYSICRQVLSLDSCEQRNSFTCRYTPTTAVSENFGFFMQTVCGWKKTEFTVNITEPSKPLIDTEDSEEYGSGSTAPIRPTGAVVGCIIMIIFIIIIFIIGISVSCVKRSKRSIPSGSQIEYERGASEKLTITTVNDQNETK
ncbi:uncharacterized protein LOC125255588 [Megalobrama amblycephala]|uniref:uncharacterized protein LOC125255588 n=1 Tax=Megalobrama amblycephala TaxID=75352 RepID=UPI00201451D8|nr:uncharacterized protein LOC125255588 [Megalobrama amblycephala]